MRDPDYTPSWSDTFAFRVRYQDSSNLPANYETHPQNSTSGAVAELVGGNDLLDDFYSGSFLADGQVDDCEAMRLSSSDLSSLRSLPPTSLVFLLTPVLAPAHVDRLNAESNTTDPFEAFGRELSKHHHRLRHVPYLPKVGMTETHVAFIEQAAAVVVVVCEPEDSDEQMLEDQQSFADEVIAKQAESTDGDDDEETPFILVQFDSTRSECIEDEYNTVLRAPALTKQAFTKAAQLLFKTET